MKGFSLLSQSGLFVASSIVFVFLFFGGWLLWRESFDDVRETYSEFESDRRKRKELRKLELEFPYIVEMFALLITAGMSPSQAFFRISQSASGEMGTLVQTIVLSLSTGKSLVNTLDEINRALHSSMIRRFNDSIILAVERGTSLAEVLNRQVDEVRSAHKARLIEKAGKAEVTLMIPVVFLILPVSVLFALWPSYFALGQSMGF